MTSNIENLIDTVSQYPIIYDKSHPNYNDYVMRADIWNQIASELKIQNGNIAEMRWLNIRKGYCNNEKKMDRAEQLKIYRAMLACDEDSTEEPKMKMPNRERTKKIIVPGRGNDYSQFFSDPDNIDEAFSLYSKQANNYSEQPKSILVGGKRYSEQLKSTTVSTTAVLPKSVSVQANSNSEKRKCKIEQPKRNTVRKKTWGEKMTFVKSYLEKLLNPPPIATASNLPSSPKHTATAQPQQPSVRTANSQLPCPKPSMPAHDGSIGAKPHNDDINNRKVKDEQYYIDNLFLGYANTFKTLSTRIQIDLKVKMAHMFAKAEIKDMQEIGGRCPRCKVILAQEEAKNNQPVNYKLSPKRVQFH